MIDNRIKIIVCVVVLVVLVIAIKNQISSSNENVESEETTTTVSNIMYDENTLEYYITDEETGEVLHSAQTEEELYIYTIDPDYNPKLPAEDTENILEEENLEY